MVDSQVNIWGDLKTTVLSKIPYRLKISSRSAKMLNLDAMSGFTGFCPKSIRLVYACLFLDYVSALGFTIQTVFTFTMFSPKQLRQMNNRIDVKGLVLTC